MALALALAVAMNKLCLPSTGAKWGCAAYAANVADKWRGRLSYVWWIKRGLGPRL